PRRTSDLRLGLLGLRLEVMILEPALVAADAPLHPLTRGIEGRVGVSAHPLSLQVRPRSQGHGAIDLEGVALAADHHVGAASSLEFPPKARAEFAGDP